MPKVKARKPKPICSECGRIKANPLNIYGKAIVRILASQGEDITSLSLKSKMGKPTLHNVMHERKMPLRALDKIAVALGVPLSELVKGAERESCPAAVVN